MKNNTNLPTLQQSSDAVVFQALKNSLYPGAKDDSVLMVLSYCKAAGLDPMTKPVHIVPMNVKDAKAGKYEWRDVVVPGIELYRTKASRTNAHAGTSEPEFGPIIEHEFGGTDKNGKALPPVKFSFPEWCRVTVRRVISGQVVEFTAREYWLENYATTGRDSEIPNSMWRKRPFGQISKCAESQALRKGFPEIGAQPTADEMYGKTIESDAIDNAPVGMKPQVEPPKAKRTGRAFGAYLDETAEIDSAEGLTAWWKKNAAAIKKDLTADEQQSLADHCADYKAQMSKAATVACPDGGVVPVAFCDGGECAKREGCPAHD